jgi:hypothetical protein
MSLPFQAGLLRLRQGADAAGPVVGTGFVVSAVDGTLYGVTCAHVANLAFGRPLGCMDPPPDTTIWSELPFAGGKRSALQVVGWRPPAPEGRARDGPVHDIAVLRFNEALVGAAALQLRQEPAERVAPEGAKVAFTGYGFMATADGLPLRGYLRGVDAGGWLVAEAEGEIGRFIQEGTSGGPLLASGAVLGMAVRRFELETRQALAVPAIALTQAFPRLARPFIGLGAFRGETAHLFFGRGQRVAELDRMLSEAGRIAVIGASGSGKSSLALAGLAPLRRRARWLVVAFRPGFPTARPLTNLADALLREAGTPAGPARSKEAGELADKMAADPSTLAAHLAGLREATGAAGTLVVVDQFEEFFVATALADERLVKERCAMLGVLLRLCLPTAGQMPTAACVLTARADLLGPVPDAADVKPFFSRPLWLEAMSEEELTETVRKPAEYFGVEVDTNLVRDLVKQMGVAQAGRLPLLQTTLEVLWPQIQQEKTTGRWRLRVPAAGVPRIADAIANRANQVVDLLPDHLKSHVDGALRQLVRVVDGKPARRVVQRNAMQVAEWEVLRDLADARLVTLSRGGEDAEAKGIATAELVHETLIESWDRLHAVVRDDAPFLRFRDGLEADRQRWEEQGRPTHRLLQDADVEKALQWEAQRPEDLSPAQRGFIAASSAERQRQRDAALREAERRTRVSNRWLRAVGAFSAVVLILAVMAWKLATEASHQRLEALRAASISLALNAKEALRAGQLERAYLIAAEAAWWPDAPNVARRPRTSEADEVLMLAARTLVAPHVPRGDGAALSRDGTRMWSYHPGEAPYLTVTRIENGRAIPDARITTPQFGDFDPIFEFMSRDGRFALTETNRSETSLLDLSAGMVPLQWPYPLYLLGSQDSSSQAVLFDLSGQTALLRFAPEPELSKLPILIQPPMRWPIDFSPDGRSLIVQIGKLATLYTLGTGNQPSSVPTPLGTVDTVAFLGNDSVISLSEGKLRFRTLLTPDGWHDQADVPGASKLIASPDGRYLVTEESAHRNPKLFKRLGEQLALVELPPASNIGFHQNGLVIEIQSRSRLSLYDRDPSGHPFLDRELGPDDPREVLMSDDGRLFFLSGGRRVEVWRRGPDRSQAQRVAIVAELGATVFTKPLTSDDKTVIAVNAVDAADYRIYDIASLSARRGDGESEAILMSAERSLTRCLTSQEVADLGLLQPGVYKEAPNGDRSSSRHACRSTLELAAEPKGYWDFWGPLTRYLIAAFGTSDTVDTKSNEAQ